MNVEKMMKLSPRFCGNSCEKVNQSSGPKIKVSCFVTSVTLTCQRLQFASSYICTDGRIDEVI